MLTDNHEHRSDSDTKDYSLGDPFLDELFQNESLDISDSDEFQFDFHSVLKEWEEQLNNDASMETLQESTFTAQSEEGEKSPTSFLNSSPSKMEGREDHPLSAHDLMEWVRTVISSRQPSEHVLSASVFYFIEEFSNNDGFTVDDIYQKIRWSSVKNAAIEHWKYRKVKNPEVDEEQGRAIKKKSRRGLRTAMVTLLLIISLCGIGYTLFVFSDIPFFVKWRTLYIETAMSTLNHQWLATSFIPKSIIDDVMDDAVQANENQKKVQTDWAEPEDNSGQMGLSEKERFYKTYWELNEDFFEEYLDKHPEYREMGYDNLVIDNLDCSDETLHTRYGEVVRAINVPDNVIIIRVKDDEYVGTLAAVKDPSQVNMKKAKEFGSEGDLIETFCEDCVLAINGSGFLDEGGLSNGSTVVGSFVMNGVDYGVPDYNYLFFGMKPDNLLHIQWGVSDVEEYRWAFQFSPALIVNGKTVVEGSYGWGLQPRSAIGQTKNGDFLMLIVDGRQVGYSIGCLVEDCAKIMQRHRAYQAVNMDGGSSSIMAYEGKIITKNSSKSIYGREIPNAIVVTHPQSQYEENERGSNE